MIGLTDEPAAAAKWASYVAGLLVLLGGAACLVLTRRSLRLIPRWLGRYGGREAPRAVVTMVCVAPVLLGAAIAVGHGCGGGLAKVLELLGVGSASIHPGNGPDRLSEQLWQILFYQPWFAAMGICLLLSAVQYLGDARFPARWVRAVIAGSVVVCLGSVALFVLSMMLHWNIAVG